MWINSKSAETTFAAPKLGPFLINTETFGAPGSSPLLCHQCLEELSEVPTLWNWCWSWCPLMVSDSSLAADAAFLMPTALFTLLRVLHRTAFCIQHFCFKLLRWPQIHASLLLVLHLPNLLVFVLSSISEILLLQLLCFVSFCPSLPLSFLILILHLFLT